MERKQDTPSLCGPERDLVCRTACFDFVSGVPIQLEEEASGFMASRAVVLAQILVQPGVLPLHWQAERP